MDEMIDKLLSLKSNENEKRKARSGKRANKIVIYGTEFYRH